MITNGVESCKTKKKEALCPRSTRKVNLFLTSKLEAGFIGTKQVYLGGVELWYIERRYKKNEKKQEKQGG